MELKTSLFFHILIFIFFIFVYYIYLNHYEEQEVSIKDAIYYSFTIHCPMIDNDVDFKEKYGKLIKNFHNVVVFGLMCV